MDICIVYMILTLLLTASITDFQSSRIPNLLTYPTMLVGIIYHSIFNGVDGLFFSAQGLGLGIALLILPYMVGGMGAGDVKLMGAAGGLLGPKDVFYSFLFSAIVGGFYAIAVILINRRNFKGFLGEKLEVIKSFILTREFTPDPGAQKNGRPRLCYGLAIALGTGSYILANIFGYHPFG
jgi:prepilin peptidase CpaA